MAKKVKSEESAPEVTVSQSTLAEALVAAINAAKPTKITAANRKRNTPWTPKDGSPKLKLKRKTFHHGLAVESRLSNQEISLLNQIKPGTYCDGFVRVTRRRDKGIDVDYPVRTASQRLKLVNQFGIRNFAELLQRIVDEGTNPTAYKTDDEDMA